MAQLRDFKETYLCSPRKLNLHSISKLERVLGYPRQYLRSLASNAGGRYDPFSQRKKARPFQKLPLSTKVRQIDNPSSELKEVQARINERLLKTLNIPSYLLGGVAGRTVLDNVMLHFEARVLVRVDIKDFFPSISNLQVYNVWRHLLGCYPKVARLLTVLTTFDRHLPQGAPTSTLLANLVLHSYDRPIRLACREQGIRYSSWVDDLAFSGDNPRSIVGRVVRTMSCVGFRISHKKLQIMGPGDRKVLGGILIGRYPNVLPFFLANVRSGIHKVRTHKVHEMDLPKYLRSLRGRIAHLKHLKPAQGERLLAELQLALSE